MDSSTSASPAFSGATGPPVHNEDASDHSLPPAPVSNKSHSGLDTTMEATTADPVLSFADKAEQANKEKVAQLLKGKEKEWSAVADRTGPLRLLDLPVDILKEIIHHLPHTNDLTSLALCHSALHSLTVPYIYSRFDIVWPDQTTHTEQRSGVDALTYGLATLVMAAELFGEIKDQQKTSPPHEPDNRSSKTHSSTLYPLPNMRRGNYYAQFTKKFSLGNGPPDWVQEYLITKEGGKMLGTLVALAVVRMKNLETFVWDMPTGVLRDVWLALSAQADRTDGQDTRLERLWIRWHDNSQTELPTAVPPPPLPINNLPPPPPPPPPITGHPISGFVSAVQSSVNTHFNLAQTPHAIDRVENVEHPTFSVIPAIRSLTVLDIDELPYLDEMSILIGRSREKLRELRVGIARHAHQKDWATAWEGDGIQQVDYSTLRTAASAINEKRLGGILGVLVGRIFNMRNHSPQLDRSSGLGKTALELEAETNRNGGLLDTKLESAARSSVEPQAPSATPNQESVQQIEIVPLPAQASELANTVNLPTLHTTAPMTHRPLPDRRAKKNTGIGPFLNGKLKLDTLELERVPLSVSVLLKALDWSILSTLTLLNCDNHEQLWKALRRTYSPKVLPSVGSPVKGKAQSPPRSDYHLNLKKIHTNTVSPSLIAFLKDALAPDTLEVLFLQEGRSYTSSVTVETIFKGAIRRHKGSLKKLLIDSSEQPTDTQVTSNSRWNKWMLTRENLAFITSGRMPSLRELAIIIDYRDWHFLLQHLPFVPHIRSLYIPYIADYVHGNNSDPRELALQVVDIVHLRPDIELCYMGILTKCFEILENKQNTDRSSDSSSSSGIEGGNGGGYGVNDGLTSDEEDDTEDEDDDDDDDDVVVTIEGSGDDDPDDDDDPIDDSEDEDSFLEEFAKGPKLRLREILFYDDKVAVFKARHGRL